MRMLFAAAALAATVFTAGAAAAQASGSYFITNNASSSVTLSANSLANNGIVSFPSPISSGATVYASAMQTSSSNVYVGTFIYRDMAGVGCNFTTTVIRSSSTGRYSFSFSAAPYSTASTAVCTMTASTTNPNTGSYSANASMSGF